MSTLSVVEEILRAADHPMSVREIVEKAGERLPTKSKTPDTVVARDLSMDIKRKGSASLFARTAPGRYAMRGKFDGVGGVEVGAPSTASPEQQAERIGDATPVARAEPMAAAAAEPGAPLAAASHADGAPTPMLSSAMSQGRAGTRGIQKAPATADADKKTARV